MSTEPFPLPPHAIQQETLATYKRGVDEVCGVIYFTLNKYLVPLQDFSAARVQYLLLDNMDKQNKSWHKTD